MISYGSLIRIAEMLALKRSHQLGEGHRCGAEMPTWTYPPRPVYGSQQHHTEMLYEDCSHLFTRGHHSNAAMLVKDRLVREGSDYARRNANAGLPFPTSFGPYDNRRNVTQQSPNFNQRPTYLCSNAMYLTPRNQGDPIWTQDMKTRL